MSDVNLLPNNQNHPACGTPGSSTQTTSSTYYGSGTPSYESQGSVYDRHGTEIGYVDAETGSVRDSITGANLGSADNLHANRVNLNSGHNDLSDNPGVQEMFDSTPLWKKIQDQT